MNKKFSNKFSKLWQRVSPDRREDNSSDESDDANPNPEARELVTHSRLAWSASQPNSLFATRPDGSSLPAHRDISELVDDVNFHFERRKVHTTHRENDGASLVGSLSTLARSPSPPGGHPLALDRQPGERRYAHLAWTPPEGAGESSSNEAEEESERRKCWLRALLVRWREKIRCGEFDEPVIGRYFKKSYSYRTTPREQQMASRSFVQIVEDRAEAKRIRFEQDERLRRGNQGSREPVGRARPSEYHIDLETDVGGFGDIVDELWRSIVVPNLL